MDSKKSNTLRLAVPGRKPVVVELDQAYNERELAVLLAAYRRRLFSEDPESEVATRSQRRLGGKSKAANRTSGF